MTTDRTIDPRTARRAVHAVVALLCLLLLAMTAHAAPATLQAEVDRQHVAADGMLTLTLRLNNAGKLAPDFSVLEKDFSVLSEHSSSGISANMSGVQSWTEWQLTLAPLRRGALTIPAFSVGAVSSQPITIQVGPPLGGGPTPEDDAAPADPSTANNTAGEPVFLEVSVDRPEVYVQQQVILTVRVFQSVPLDDMNITELEFDNASVHKLGQTKSQREINGVAYQIHELRYAIFPQQSGELTVPEIVFTARELRRPRSLFDLGARGQSVRKLSRQLNITVKPVPPQFSGKTWLPARNLTLQETWGGDPASIRAGDSITRSVAIQADGLTAAQMPALAQPQLAKARLYADQPVLNDQADDSGMHGIRTDSAALIPAQPGPLQLPEVRVAWWDIDSDSEKIAVIPAQTLSILPGVATPAAPPSPPATSPITKPATAGEGAAITSVRSAPPTLWMAVSGLFAVLWLITLALFWQLRRRLSQLTAPVTKPATAAPRDTLKPLLEACKRNDAKAASAALDIWVRTNYSRHRGALAAHIAERQYGARTDASHRRFATRHLPR